MGSMTRTVNILIQLPGSKARTRYISRTHYIVIQLLGNTIYTIQSGLYKTNKKEQLYLKKTGGKHRMFSKN